MIEQLFILENAFELIVILIAFIRSGFARLPMMVAVNIILFSFVSAYIEWQYETTISPGYEIYYGVCSFYFIVMAAIFFLVKNKFYLMVGAALIVQATANAIILSFPDSSVVDLLLSWSSDSKETTIMEVMNDRLLFIECILVWLSSVNNERKS